MKKNFSTVAIAFVIAMSLTSAVMAEGGNHPHDNSGKPNDKGVTTVVGGPILTFSTNSVVAKVKPSDAKQIHRDQEKINNQLSFIANENAEIAQTQAQVTAATAKLGVDTAKLNADLAANAGGLVIAADKTDIRKDNMTINQGTNHIGKVSATAAQHQSNIDALKADQVAHGCTSC